MTLTSDEELNNEIRASNDCNNRGLPPSQHEGDYTLPSLTKKARKDLGPDLLRPGIHQGGLLNSIESSQVYNTTRARRQSSGVMAYKRYVVYSNYYSNRI
jgi:hypothetical protein